MCAHCFTAMPPPLMATSFSTSSAWIVRVQTTQVWPVPIPAHTRPDAGSKAPRRRRSPTRAGRAYARIPSRPRRCGIRSGAGQVGWRVCRRYKFARWSPSRSALAWMVGQVPLAQAACGLRGKGTARRPSLRWRCGVLPCWTVSLAQAVELAPSEGNVGNLVPLLGG